MCFLKRNSSYRSTIIESKAGLFSILSPIKLLKSFNSLIVLVITLQILWCKTAIKLVVKIKFRSSNANLRSCEICGRYILCYRVVTILTEFEPCTWDRSAWIVFFGEGLVVWIIIRMLWRGMSQECKFYGINT
jgi:hypothetical protein